MEDLDNETLEKVYSLLRGDYPQAALQVADLLLQDGPEEYARQLTGMTKISAIKELRSVFGMKLKDAKSLYEKAHESGA